MSVPVISNVTTTAFTISWNSSEPLNTQVHFGVGDTSSSDNDWSLVGNHSLTVGGLSPDTTYEVQAESSDYSNPDLFASLQYVTTGAPNSMSAPVISGITDSSFIVSWTTGAALNSQLHYGIGNTSTVKSDWTLATNHSISVTGLSAGVTYSIQAESSDYSDPDYWDPVQFVTTTNGSNMTTPVISVLTSSSFTISWATGEMLNTQVHFGIGNVGSSQDDWTLQGNHSLTVSGLEPGAIYDVEAESSDYSNPDYVAPVETVVMPGVPLFQAAPWLYSAPSGSYADISVIGSQLGFSVETHADGFDYPVVSSDESNGTTIFTDQDGVEFTVPNPPGGYWPSVGGWGANDGHLVVVDVPEGQYFDFWKLYASNGVPSNENDVPAIVEGALDNDGVPGTSAATITGAAGDIMPGELSCATCLNHALIAAAPWTLVDENTGTQAPAQKNDGVCTSGGNVVLSEGAKLRFDPSVDLSSLNVSTAAKAILRALQIYGAAIVDKGGNGTSCGQITAGISFYSSVQMDPAPNLTSDLTSVVGQHLWIYY